MQNPDVKLPKTNDANCLLLHRALSTIPENQVLVNNQRKILAKNYRRTAINDEIVTIDHDDADALFILPNLYELPDNLRLRVMGNLVDTPRMVSLEETKRLNWWVNQTFSCPKLYPLATSGDGNCLLHATSLAMWGFHDHALSMRKALNETLITSKPNNSLYRRWRWAQSVQNKRYNLVFSEQEWDKEWKNLLRLSSVEPRISQNKISKSIRPMDKTNHSKSSPVTVQYYESLEQFHVYVLANNIRRPIIIYSDTILRTDDGEAISSIEFGGIYLPLEIPPDKCHKQPVFLGFEAAHFLALVPMESTSKVTYQMPLIDLDTLDLLPIHFFIDPSLSFPWPIDEELSDETIHVYTNDAENRLDVLEKYLNLSKKYSSLTTLIPSSITTSSDDQSSIISSINSINLDSSNEINSSKKSSRSSLNSFSKRIRRTLREPFSSTKRVSLKQQDHPSSTINENSSEQPISSQLLNRHTNILTIILTNFQPKRPTTSNNMIQNYIQTCINEYQSKHDNKNLQTNSQSSVYYRHHLSATDHQENVFANTPSNKEFTPNIPKNSHIDDNEPIENGSSSTNINYVQQKPNQNNNQHLYIRSHINGNAIKSSPSQN